jgi:hypothetical protein
MYPWAILLAKGHRPVASVRWSRARSRGSSSHWAPGRRPTPGLSRHHDRAAAREPLTGQALTPESRGSVGDRQRRSGAPRGARDPITRSPQGSASRPLPPGRASRTRPPVRDHKRAASSRRSAPFGDWPPQKLRARSRRGGFAACARRTDWNSTKPWNSGGDRNSFARNNKGRGTGHGTQLQEGSAGAEAG